MFYFIFLEPSVENEDDASISHGRSASASLSRRDRNRVGSAVSRSVRRRTSSTLESRNRSSRTRRKYSNKTEEKSTNFFF